MTSKDKYMPTIGDRVRVTYEGVVDECPNGRATDEFGRVRVSPDGIRTIVSCVWPEDIEKIRGPEPEWRDGDVIKGEVYIPAYRIDGHWLTCNGSEHRYSRDLSLSDAWNRGAVTVLYKEEPRP